MIEAVRNLSDAVRGGDAPAGEPNADAVGGIAREGESLRDVLASARGIEHTTGGRTTTVEPGTGHYAYAAVTGRRVTFVVGDDPETPVASFELGDLSRVEVSEGLLRTRLVVASGEETVRFEPVEGDDEAVERVADRLDRVNDAWAATRSAVAAAREALDTFEAALDDDGDAQHALMRARTRISKAHHCARREEAAPTDRLRSAVEPLEERLTRLRTRRRVELIEGLTEEIEDARPEDVDAAYAAYVEATETAAEARRALADVDDEPPTADRLEDLCDRLDDVGMELLVEPEVHCRRAQDAEEPGETADRWEAATEAYRAALSNGWDGQAGVSAAALRFQLAWVVRNFLDALFEHAMSMEAAADDMDDGARARYETALERLERARAIAEEYPYAEPDRFAVAAERVDGKVEHARWQWGTVE